MERAEFRLHDRGGRKVLEMVAGDGAITSWEDYSDLIGECFGVGARAIVVRAEHFVPEFFDLKTRMLGEFLQKFSTYGIRIAIVGDLSGHESASLRDFIRESNRTGGSVLFADSSEGALDRLG